MRQFLLFALIILLLGGFFGSAFAAYNGAGLVASGSPTTRSILFPVFSGGGPGSGK